MVWTEECPGVSVWPIFRSCLSERGKLVFLQQRGRLACTKQLTRLQKEKKFSSPIRSSRDDNTGEDRAKNLVPDSQLVYTDTAPWRADLGHWLQRSYGHKPRLDTEKKNGPTKSLSKRYKHGYPSKTYKGGYFLQTLQWEWSFTSTWSLAINTTDLLSEDTHRNTCSPKIHGF